MHPYFICNQDEISAKLKLLVETGKPKDGWSLYYKDTITNDNWILTQFGSEYHGGGFSVLKRQPELTIDQLIEIATASMDKNDIIGASLELYERERYYNTDFRQNLLDRLLKYDIRTLSEFDRERLKIIIGKSSLYDSTNRREILGKQYNEIEKDAEYFRVISQRAKSILQEMDKYGG